MASKTVEPQLETLANSGYTVRIWGEWVWGPGAPFGWSVSMPTQFGSRVEDLAVVKASQ